jgi:hypothetical protein
MISYLQGGSSPTIFFSILLSGINQMQATTIKRAKLILGLVKEMAIEIA